MWQAEVMMEDGEFAEPREGEGKVGLFLFSFFCFSGFYFILVLVILTLGRNYPCDSFKDLAEKAPPFSGITYMVLVIIS